MGVNELNSVNSQTKAGQCPHGLPFGACPVCTPAGGAGLRRPDKSGRPGEMSYHECAMIGAMMRARALAQKNHEANLKLHALNLEQFETAIAKSIENTRSFIQTLSNNFILKPVALVLRFTAIPLLNITLTVSKVLRMLNNLRINIMDKLNAVFGEAKAFLNKKLEEMMKVLKSPFEWLGKIFKKNNADDEDTKIDDDKRIFNLKNLISKIREKFKHREDKEK